MHDYVSEAAGSCLSDAPFEPERDEEHGGDADEQEPQGDEEQRREVLETAVDGDEVRPPDHGYQGGEGGVSGSHPASLPSITAKNQRTIVGATM